MYVYKSSKLSSTTVVGNVVGYIRPETKGVPSEVVIDGSIEPSSVTEVRFINMTFNSQVIKFDPRWSL